MNLAKPENAIVVYEGTLHLPNCGNVTGEFVFASQHRRKVSKLETALEKCVATFDDLQRVLRLLGRPVLADACMVAADSSRDVLTSQQRESK